MASYSIKCLFLALVMKNYLYASSVEKVNNDEPRARIPQGTLQGTTRTTRNNRRISAHLGIPYAQPPIGNLRFTNPVAADGWDGTRDASVDSNICPQISKNGIAGNEDCLYLNVYTPQFTKNAGSRLLPVMVFIHGGRFLDGNVNSLKYGPEYLLDKDVILVTFNYRVGPLGYLSTGDEVASGNWGLKDQVLALKWIRSNIKYFGGDPDQVTLFGQSAGAVSVHLLTMLNVTIGLFNRYILESGSALAPWAYRPSGPYAKQAFDLAKYVGCCNASTDSLIQCLRTVDVLGIVNSYPKFASWQSSPPVAWGPTDEPNIDGAVLTDSPQSLIRHGRVQDLPRILGVCRDEALVITLAFYQNEKLLDDLLANFERVLPLWLNWNYLPGSGAAWIEPIKSYYFNDFEADKNVHTLKLFFTFLSAFDQNQTRFNDLLANFERVLPPLLNWNYLPSSGAAWIEPIKSYYFNDFKADKNAILANLTVLISDVSFFYPAYNALRQQFATAMNPQYFYSFDYRGVISYSYTFAGTTVNYGVAHEDELVYLFPDSATFGSLNETRSEKDHEMVDIMVELWTSFAIEGKPTTRAFGNDMMWEPFSIRKDNNLHIGNYFDPALTVQYFYFKKRLQFWDDLIANVPL